jgi:hypothetical protein
VRKREEQKGHTCERKVQLYDSHVRGKAVQNLCTCERGRVARVRTDRSHMWAVWRFTRVSVLGGYNSLYKLTSTVVRLTSVGSTRD